MPRQEVTVSRLLPVRPALNVIGSFDWTILNIGLREVREGMWNRRLVCLDKSFKEIFKK